MSLRINCIYCKGIYIHRPDCHSLFNEKVKEKEKELFELEKTGPKVLSQQEQFEKSKALVDRVAARDLAMANFAKELGTHLEKFSTVTFKKFPNTEVTGMIFAGVKKEKTNVIVGASKCNHGDLFNEMIGKLIAVRRALNLDTKDIYTFLDEYNDIKELK